MKPDSDKTLSKYLNVIEDQVEETAFANLVQ